MYNNMNSMQMNIPNSMPAMNMYNNITPQSTQQFANDQAIRINPMVMKLIEPIIAVMTQYEMFKKSSATTQYGLWSADNSLNDYEKRHFGEAKKQCVHLIRDISNGQLVPTLEELDDTKFKCRLCGAEVYKKFDSSATAKISEANAVLNMLAFFGMTLNMTPEHMSKIIFLKQSMPDINQLVGNLNKFVTEEDKSINNAANIGEASRNTVWHTGSLLGY